MSFKIYNNILSRDEIEEIINHTNNHCLSIEGKVGNRVNLKQKIRSDIFITNEKFLKKIDNIVYNNLYEKIKNDFGVDINLERNGKLVYMIVSMVVFIIYTQMTQEILNIEKFHV